MKKHIVCFGDSNTHGFDGDEIRRFDETERWTCLLQELLGDEYLVIEEGLGSRTTAFEDPITEGVNALSVITPVLMSHEPIDLLVIMLGTNDTKSRFSLIPNEIALGLERLIKKAKFTECWNNEPKILVVVPKNIDKEYENSWIYRDMGPGCAEKSEELAKYFKEVAYRNNCFYLDANEYDISNNRVDCVHLDLKGHKKLANVLAKKIKEII